MSEPPMCFGCHYPDEEVHRTGCPHAPPSYEDGFTAGIAQGRAEERERIVAWLREQPKLGEFPTWRGTADLIEVGAHASFDGAARLTPPEQP